METPNLQETETRETLRRFARELARLTDTVQDLARAILVKETDPKQLGDLSYTISTLGDLEATFNRIGYGEGN